jgi:hypothetical protein
MRSALDLFAADPPTAAAQKRRSLSRPDGRLYTPMIREPIFIYGATSAELTRTHGRAVSRGIRFAIYTAPLFTTTNDAENRANVAPLRPRPLISSVSDFTRSQSHRQNYGRPEIPGLMRGDERRRLLSAESGQSQTAGIHRRLRRAKWQTPQPTALAVSDVW